MVWAEDIEAARLRLHRLHEIGKGGVKITVKAIRETLEKQLLLLSERSQECAEDMSLAALSSEMASISRILLERCEGSNEIANKVIEATIERINESILEVERSNKRFQENDREIKRILELYK